MSPPTAPRSNRPRSLSGRRPVFASAASRPLTAGHFFSPISALIARMRSSSCLSTVDCLMRLTYTAPTSIVPTAMQASSAVPEAQRPVDRDEIAAVERVIRPYVRHTPTITVEAQDFGLDAAPLVMKLEFLQHTGSFKPRG